MKKIVKLSLVAGVLASVSVVPFANAAEVGKVDTEGTVIFKQQGKDSVGEVIKPDTGEDVIDPEEGGHTTGPLRLTHVPSFDFDVVEINTKTLLQPALMTKFKDVDDVTGAVSSDSEDIVHFAQVEDVRGIKGDWELKVSAGKFIPGNTVKNSPLDNSHIIFAETQTTNTRITDATELAARVTTAGNETALPNNGNAISLLKTKAAQHTDVSKTSIVFNSAYTKNNLTGGAVAVDGKLSNPGVKLKAFGTDEKAIDDTYKATITWTLESAL